MINLAHFKGHAMGGFGGVLKNQSIGVASSSGKLYIHSAGRSTTRWISNDQDGFLESMAAAAQAVHDYFKADGRNIVYIDVMNNMSVDCDCDGHPAAPRLKDIGILASTDPVALDKACLDLVFGHIDADGDGKFSTPGNWVAGKVPFNGASLVFNAAEMSGQYRQVTTESVGWGHPLFDAPSLPSHLLRVGAGVMYSWHRCLVFLAQVRK